MSETLGEVCARLAGVERDGTFQAAVATALRDFAGLEDEGGYVEVNEFLTLRIVCRLPEKAKRGTLHDPEDRTALPIDDIGFVLSCDRYRGVGKSRDSVSVAIANGQLEERLFVGYDAIKDAQRAVLSNGCVRIYLS